MKISELNVGEQIKARWLLKTCEVRKTNTRPPRDYLQAVLTDGTDEIRGMLWNYINVGNIPKIGKAHNITAQVGEYNGTKQLTLTRLELADNQDMKEFLPDLGYDTQVLYTVALSIIERIQNDDLRAVVQHIYSTYREELLIATAAKGIHHAGLGGLLKHSLEVTIIAHAIADAYDGIPINKDLIIAGGMLHDIGKLKVYEYNDCLIDMTDDGMLIEHIPIGIAMLEPYTNEENEDTMRLLKHIIASHHGKLEYGASVTPKFAEAYIINHADGLSATLDMLRTANRKATDDRYTAKVYVLDNRPQLLQDIVMSTLNGGILHESEV